MSPVVHNGEAVGLNGDAMVGIDEIGPNTYEYFTAPPPPLT